MASLLNRILNRKAPAPAGGAPANIEETLRQKQTGKATTTRGARGPQLGVDIVAAEGKAKSRQLGQAGALEDQALKQQAGDIEAKSELQQKGIEAEASLASRALTTDRRLKEEGILELESLQVSQIEADTYRKITQLNTEASLRLNNLASQRQTTIDKLFSSFDRENLALSDKKDELDLELAAASLALQDKQYVHAIEMIGRERRLEKELQFKEEAARLIFGDSYTDFLEDINFTESFNKSNREFEVDLQKLTDQEIEALVMKQLDAEAKIATAQAWASALSSTTSAAASYAAQGGFDTPDPTPEFSSARGRKPMENF